MEPPTPRPELLDPNGTGSLPPICLGSVQYRVWEARSSLTQSVSGSQNGPASRQTTLHPARASRWVRTLPPAPAPTTTRSTSSRLGVAAHVGAQPVVGPGPVGGQQPRGFVPGPDVPVEAHGSGPRSVRCAVRRAGEVGVRAAGPFDAGGEGHRVGVDPVGGFPPLPGVDAGVQVPAGVGGAGEPDLVPRPGVGVERGAGVPGPQAPHLGGGVVVPRLGRGARGPARPGSAPPARPVAAGRTAGAVPVPRRPGRGSRRVARHACPSSGRSS